MATDVGARRRGRAADSPAKIKTIVGEVLCQPQAAMVATIVRLIASAVSAAISGSVRLPR